MKAEFVRNPYNYDSDKLSTETGLHCKDESLTEQEHLEETDINYIADRFMKTGMAPQVVDMPTYDDFAGTFDFQSAMNLINQAKHEFMSLPAKVRTRFNNDPKEILDFLNDPSNKDEAIKLGFITKPLDTAKETEDARTTESEGRQGERVAPQDTRRPQRSTGKSKDAKASGPEGPEDAQ